MLTEIISLWFKDAEHVKLLSLGAILLALGAIRVVAHATGREDRLRLVVAA